MAAGLHVAVKVGMVLLTAVTLVPVTVARADCLSDIVNGFVNTLSAAGSDACASACADSAGSGCAAAAAVAASLGAAAAGGGQGTVGSFCSNINNANNDLASIQSYLGVLGDSAGSILDALQQTGIADPLNVIQCGCSLEQGIDQLGSAASSCLQGLLCDLQNAAFPGTCGCTPTPPTAANCTPSDACSSYTNPQTYNQDCANTIAGNYGPGYYPVVKTTEPGGTLITSMQDPHCGGGLYCFCPSPMQVVYKDDLFQDGGNTNNGFFTVYCECPRNPNNPNDPENTHPAQKSGPLALVCICDATGQQAVSPNSDPTTNPTHSICPTPLTGLPCPIAGQIRVRGNKCVAPCSNSNEVMTPDGICCNPNNVAACGQCCPPGTTPNLVNGTCGPPSTIQ